MTASSTPQTGSSVGLSLRESIPELPARFRFAAVHAGIRPDGAPGRLDLALVTSDVPAAAAGAFTQNRVRAAPVRVSRERLPRSDARGVIMCSGNANACTGRQGLDDARAMARLAAESLGCGEETILVCSTGVIGRPLPMNRIEPAIPQAVRSLAASSEAFVAAAQAILTTDTRIKTTGKTLHAAGNTYTLAGFAKGAAMIGPNMATMLAFVFSDAPVSHEHLARLVPRIAEATFNCVRVEGHTSTNDSLLVFTNGDGPPLEGADLARFDAAVGEVCGALARAIAADAEGATHLVTIHVDGLRDTTEARRVAVAIADSALVKTAIFGADPNWGRIVSAAGYAGVAFEETDLSLWLGDVLLYDAGTPTRFDAAAASDYLKRHREVTLRLKFTLGESGTTIWTSDLTHDYVTLNAEYTT